MKKIFYFLFSLIILCSCDSNYRKESARLAEENPISSEIVEFGIKTNNGKYYRDEMRIKKFNYEGHSYIFFMHSSGPNSRRGGVTHDPNCECFITK